MQMRDLVSQPGVEPRHPDWEDGTSDMGPPGKFPGYFIFNSTFQVDKGNPFLPSQIILRD